MPNQFDTSFIPQQPLLRVEAVRGRHEPLNFALVLALILFFVVLITAGGIYFYSRSIDARILARSTELANLEETLDSSSIAEYKDIESRINNAKVVVRDHSVFSVILALLESGAADNIGLTRLVSSARENKFFVNIGGVGPSYQSVYFQLETWRRISPLVLGVDLSEISLEDKTGLVVFNAKIEIKPELMKYSGVYQTIQKIRTEEGFSQSKNTEVEIVSEVNSQTP